MPSDEIQDRSKELVDEYSQKLDGFVNNLIPLTLDNQEFAARCSALMIALNRQLARCAASFGGVYNVDSEEMTALVYGQFARNFRISRESMQGQGSRIQ